MLFQTTLDEEQQTDLDLTALAESSVNIDADQVPLGIRRALPTLLPAGGTMGSAEFAIPLAGKLPIDATS